MSSHLLGGCLAFLMATGFFPAGLSVGEAKAEQVRGKPVSELSGEEETELGIFVLNLLETGVNGKNVRDTVEGKVQEFKNNRALKAVGRGGATGRGRGRGTGPGQALRHGLQNKDIAGLGRFVNEKLAQGLRGEELAQAIKAETIRRKQQRRAGASKRTGPARENR